MALTDMAGDTIATLPDDQLENAVRAQILTAMEDAGFAPAGVTSDGMTEFQRYQRGERQVLVGVVVLT